MPWVTLPEKPSGLPIASTICPTLRFAERPKVAGVSPFLFSTWMIARSPGG
ncbi:UNVERIFIED_ORG: hypothetical protein FHR35_002594 [Microbispora rosea subsp. rosea]